jgi:hypothetical protein
MDALLILKGDAASARREIGQHARIAHEASPRVIVVAGEDDALRSLVGRQDVVAEEALSTGGVPADLALTPAEEMFVKSWLERRRLERTKQRRGEGLSWDTKGFDAP